MRDMVRGIILPGPNAGIENQVQAELPVKESLSDDDDDDHHHPYIMVRGCRCVALTEKMERMLCVPIETCQVIMEKKIFCRKRAVLFIFTIH